MSVDRQYDIICEIGVTLLSFFFIKKPIYIMPFSVPRRANSYDSFVF